MSINPVFPPKLHKGSHVRIIAPSRSAAILSSQIIAQATRRLTEAGFTVSFGAHWQEIDDDYLAASVDARLEDLHAAFADPTVDGILTAIGGYNANQLLQRIDYDLIRTHPKVLCGYSDITALCNAIFARTGVVTYHGPHFSSWGMQQGLDYSVQAVRKGVEDAGPYVIEASETWSDDAWFIDQDNRTFIPNSDGNLVLQPGKNEGTVLGGHLSTFLRLVGTPYWPGLSDSILCIEQSAPVDFRLFDAYLTALVQQSDFDGVRGMLIGRFQKDCHITVDLLRRLVNAKPALRRIPVIANINFGHTTPITVFPIGGRCHIDATTHSISVTVTNH